MDKKKKTAIIVVAAVAVAAAVYFGVSYFLDRDIESQEEELAELQQEEVETGSGQVVKTELCNFEDGEFFVKIPADFEQLSQEMLAQKYDAENLPSYAFSNQEGTVNVVFSVTDANLKEEEIESFIESMAALTSGEGEEPKTSVYEKEGHVIGSVEMVTAAADTDIYNNMAVFSVDGKMRMVSFNCTEELRQEWQPVGEFIVKSLHFPAE